MNPGHRRQPQIIRPLAAVALAAATLVPASAAAQRLAGDQGAPCVSCLVIGMDPADLASRPDVADGSLDGVQLMLMAVPRGEILPAGGASLGVLITPSAAETVLQIVFDARTTMTALRAGRPDVQIAIDGDAFAARGVPLDELLPYVDAIVRGPEGSAPRGLSATWTRLPAVSNPTVDDLVAASLTPGAERVLLPVAHLDWRVVQEFAARPPGKVHYTARRRLPAGGILQGPQAQQRRQYAIVRTTIATGTTTLLFEVPDVPAPITITAETTIFRGPNGINIEERGIRVNGAAIAGGGAQSPPELPLIEAERISTPPLAIALDEAYRYALHGEDTVGDSRCYVVGFEPRGEARGLARGRAWIDVRDFTLRRLETIQPALRGAIAPSEQIDEFGRVDVAGAAVWLPTETRIFQTYEGAGLRTPIHRTIAVRRYDVNSDRFDAQLAAALASDNVMMRETPEGLRYLVRRGSSGARGGVARGGPRNPRPLGGGPLGPNNPRPPPPPGAPYTNPPPFRRRA